jgi:membrane protein YdbS with pleckstrin-like domain
MNFSNLNVVPAELPTVENIPFQPLEKDYLLVERMSAGITSLVILVIAIFVFYFIESLQETLTMLLAGGVLILIFVLSFISTTISFKYSGYALREKDILFKSGWIIRKIRIVMLDRIQHVSVQSGPIERKYGLSSVSIYTAGSSQADFTISGISEETALRIKQWISTNMNGSSNE